MSLSLYVSKYLISSVFQMNDLSCVQALLERWLVVWSGDKFKLVTLLFNYSIDPSVPSFLVDVQNVVIEKGLVKDYVILDRSYVW